MGLLYAWATPEYLLWHMTIGQIVMMHNCGLELKYPAPEKSGSLINSDYDSIMEKRKELIDDGLMDASEKDKKYWQDKYGEI